LVLVTNVGVQPNVASLPGDVLGVYVYLNAPAPSPMVLDVAIFQNVGGNYQPVNPPGFIFPQPTVQPGMQSVTFQMVRDGGFLIPGQYEVGVGMGGTIQATGSFQVT
jgi:hypothetical protein